MINYSFSFPKAYISTLISKDTIIKKVSVIVRKNSIAIRIDGCMVNQNNVFDFVF